MRWQTGRRSTNIEDRRGRSAARLGIGGGLGGLVLVVLWLFLGGDPSMLQQLPEGGLAGEPAPYDGQGEPYVGTPEEERLREIVSAVLADTEDTWHALFLDMGGSYREPTLVLFTDTVQSGCGFAQAQVGPFYCPANGKVYLDLSFFRDLEQRFGAPGDFAQAYVVAHEVGHHVQNLMGLAEDNHRARQRARSQEEANELSVRFELQADCFAGVWAHHAHASRRFLDPGDVEEGLAAAGAIGDDRIQMQSQGYVAPESWTHGAAEQRARWLRRGIETGDVRACDTFAVGAL
jgi:predicted metalloprotease